MGLKFEGAIVLLLLPRFYNFLTKKRGCPGLGQPLFNYNY